MPEFSVAIPASPFLMQRMAGLNGVARCVILADLEGASRIFVVAPMPLPSDWAPSFRYRERALPEVVRVDRVEDIPELPGDRLIVLAGDRLPTRTGMARMRDRPGDKLVEGADFHAAGPPRAITWKILLASMKPGEGWFGRNINRPISFRVSALLLRTDISPNAVTWFTFALAMVMVAVLSHGGYWWLAGGGALYQAVSVIDCIDGDIARVTYRTSHFGSVLDTAFDMLANLGFVAGLTLGLVHTYGMSQLYVAGGLVILAAICMMLMTLLVRLGPRRGSFDVLRSAIAVKLADRPRLRKAVLTAEKIFKRDFYALFAGSLCLSGLAWLVPQLGIAGVFIWLLAILWCAPAIVADKEGALLPAHLKAT